MVYDVITIEITASEDDIDNNELELADAVSELQEEIERLFLKYRGSKLSFRIAPEWELEADE